MEEPSINISENTQSIWKPDVVVIGPGGVKGYLELGALYKLEKEHFYDNTLKFTGVSAGAGIALLIVAGYTVNETIRTVWDVNLLSDITDLSIEQIRDRGGLFSGNSIEQLLTSKVKQKFGMIPTLQQLYMFTGKTLQTVTYNADEQRTEYLDKDTEPQLSCVQAVMMSLAIPFVIQARRYKGKDYVDGAVGNPYPVDIHDDGETNVLGIYISSEKQISTGIIRKAFNILHASMDQLRIRIIESSSDRCKHIKLCSSVLDSTGATVSDAGKKEMIRKGYAEATKFLDTLKNPDKYKVLLGEDEEIPVVSTDLKNEPTDLTNDTNETISGVLNILDNLNDSLNINLSNPLQPDVSDIN